MKLFLPTDPMQDWIRELSDVAQYVVAIGDCATWGRHTGCFRLIQVNLQVFQFHKKEKRRIPGSRFLFSKGGFAGNQYSRLSQLTRIGLRKFLVAIFYGARIGDVFD
jgi:coenzyme F420-reducing hydrogenase gamma subunit